MKTTVDVSIKGHLNITDDLGKVLLDKTNAVHPGNLSRAFARSLANEHNYFVNRIAYGNGGTIVDAAQTITYKTPNDGQPPDINTWGSRLYNETYSEIIDEGQTILNPLIGTDPGSADNNTGIRTGGGAFPAGDPPSIPHVSGPGVRSNDLGMSSEVIISATINGSEPLSEFISDSNPPQENTETDFVFDEIALFTGGGPAIPTAGSQNINIGNRKASDDTGLLLGTAYSFDIAIDGGTPIVISFSTPINGGSGIGKQILYGDLVEAINVGSTDWGFSGVSPLPGGTVIQATDDTLGTFPTMIGAQTFGFLQFQSGTTGFGSTINLVGINTTTFLLALNPPAGATLEIAVIGNDAGLQNAPTTPELERERLLTHIIFSPILKSKNRTLNITYTLTIMVARTPLL